MSASAPMFTEYAELYDALYSFKDYRQEAREIRDAINLRQPAARSLLDVACGTGMHLALLREDFAVQGVDVNPKMVEIARSRCPGIAIHEADMVTLALPDRFDVIICLFSSIAYLRTVERMHAAVAAMARHLRPDGLLVIEPWFSPETYSVGRVTLNTSEDGDCKIAWMYTSERRDSVSVLEINYLVGDPQGVRHFVERHELGLFTAEEYVAAYRDAGLEVDHDPMGPLGRGLYIGQAAP
jgi:ubiquinone/menaquinone biosynthesis C-methylase UbiE